MAAPNSPGDWALRRWKKWEMNRCRGWLVSGVPCRLEAGHTPLHHSIFKLPPVSDDNRRPSLLSRVFEPLRLLFSSPEQEEQENDDDDPDQIAIPDPSPATSSSDLVTLRLALPGNGLQRHVQAEQLLLTLQKAQLPISWEYVGSSEAIHAQVVVRRGTDAALCKQMLAAYCPELVVEEVDDVMASAWHARQPAALVDFGLAKSCIFSLAVGAATDIDPIPGIVAAMEHLKLDELVVVQTLFQSVREDWAKDLVRGVTEERTGGSINSETDLPKYAQQKVSRPLYAAVIRVAATSPDEERPWFLVKAVGAALSCLKGDNELLPLKNSRYPYKLHRQDFLLRRTHRVGLLLNARELAALVRLPVAVSSSKLVRFGRKTKAPPPEVRGHALVIGSNTHAGQTVPVSLSSEQKLRHVWMMGGTGTGKSTALAHMALAEMTLDQGVCLVDPHGDTINKVIAHVPAHRMADVVLFDPSAPDPIGINLLGVRDAASQQALAADLTAIFKRLSSSPWSDQMTSCLHYALAALWDAHPSPTLVTLQRFLAEPRFRQDVLAAVTDEGIAYFWNNDFKLMRSHPEASLLTRLGAFLRPGIRTIVGTQGIDLEDLIEQGKILLVRLSTGAVGAEAVHTLASILIARILQTAMARLDPTKRRPFHLYLDEAHLFTCPSLALILSGARKYGLGLTICHQNYRQITQRDAEVAAALSANAGTRIFFRSSDDDMGRLTSDFSHFDATDFANLRTGEAICRVGTRSASFNLSVTDLPLVAVSEVARRTEAIIRQSRAQFIRPEQALPNPVVPLPKPVIELPTLVPPSTSKLTELDAPPPSPEATLPPQPIPTTPATCAPPSPPVAKKKRRAGVSATHRAIQEQVKQAAEARGFKAAVEVPILDGLARVDVVLLRDKLSIAVEVGVSSSAKQEAVHIANCIAAGFSLVIACSLDEDTLGKTKKVVLRALSEDEQVKVRYLTPEEVSVFLDTLTRKQESVCVVKGWKVTTSVNAEASTPEQLQQDVVSEVIMQVQRRMKHLD